MLAYPGCPGKKPLNGCVCVCVLFHCNNNNGNEKSRSNLGRAMSPPLTQRMGWSAVCSSCAIPLQTSPITQPQVCYIHIAVPHSSYTLHCTVWLTTPQVIHRPTWPTTPNDIIGIHTLNFYCYYLCTVTTCNSTSSGKEHQGSKQYSEIYWPHVTAWCLQWNVTCVLKCRLNFRKYWLLPPHKQII